MFLIKNQNTKERNLVSMISNKNKQCWFDKSHKEAARKITLSFVPPNSPDILLNPSKDAHDLRVGIELRRISDSMRIFCLERHPWVFQEMKHRVSMHHSNVKPFCTSFENWTPPANASIGFAFIDLEGHISYELLLNLRDKILPKFMPGGVIAINVNTTMRANFFARKILSMQDHESVALIRHVLPERIRVSPLISSTTDFLDHASKLAVLFDTCLLRDKYKTLIETVLVYADSVPMLTLILRLNKTEEPEKLVPIQKYEDIYNFESQRANRATQIEKLLEYVQWLETNSSRPNKKNIIAGYRSYITKLRMKDQKNSIFA